MYTITLIPGDGVGPPVIDAARRVIEATGVSIQWDLQEAGQKVIAARGTPIPEEVLESIRHNKVALKGPITTPIGTGFRSVNVTIRKALDLYVNLRPTRAFPGIKTDHPDLNLIVIRENTEDLYSGIEFEQGSESILQLREFMLKENIVIPEDAACSFKVISWEASVRILRFAFEYAVFNRRRKLTVVHKANILKATDGLFLKAARVVSQEFPEIDFEEKIISNMCLQLVQRPTQFDVLVLPNLYGDIISDLCAGLVGGLGLVPSANLGEHAAVFEPVHGSAPKYEGQNRVNPMAAILSGALMLRHIGEEEGATLIEKAVGETLSEGKIFTADVKTHSEASLAVGTEEVTVAIIEKVKDLRIIHRQST